MKQELNFKYGRRGLLFLCANFLERKILVLKKKIIIKRRQYMEENELQIISDEEIKDLIYIVRGKQVMLDSDVANLYHYKTKRINETVNRNK